MHISEMQLKKSEKFFCFRDNGVSSCCKIFCMFRREYLSSVVNVLKKYLKMSDQTRADFFKLNLSPIHEKIG